MSPLSTAQRMLRFHLNARHKAAPRLAFISGAVGSENLGDEAFPEAMERLFPPFSMVDYRGERSIGYVNQFLKTMQGGLMAGGTLINASPKHMKALDKCIRFLPRNIVFGTGVRSPHFWGQDPAWVDYRKQWVEVLKRCDFVGVRGPISASLLEDAGFTAEIVGDPALAFVDETRTLGRPASRIHLGLNVGQSLGKVWGSEDQIVDEYAALARKARELGWRITWFVVWPEDLEATRRAAEMSGTGENMVCEYVDATRYMEHVQSLTFFVGLKLHAVVFAICAGVPSLMVEYRPKCRDFMQSVDQDHATIRSDEFEGEAVVELLQEWHRDWEPRRDAMWETVCATALKQRVRAREVAQQVFGIQGAGG